MLSAQIARQARWHAFRFDGKYLWSRKQCHSTTLVFH